MGKFFGLFWRQALFYVAIIVTVTTTLWWRLGTLVPDMSLPEQAARANANSFAKLINNPIFLPHKVLQYLFIWFGYSDAFWMRTASALWAVLILLVFYDIVRDWYSRRVALMSAGLLLTSAWFLHFARLGTPYILFATSIGLLWIGTKLKLTTAPRIRTMLTGMVIIITCLYVPGLAWLIIPLLIWQRKFIWNEFTKIPRWMAGLAVAGLMVGLLPLVYGLVRHPSLIRDWLYIPHNLLTPGLYLSHAWHIPVWIMFRGPQLPVYWLGHVPMFDSFSLVMVILGVFVLSYYRLLDRVKAIAVILSLSLILAVLNGWLALVIALPLLFIVISAGIALFLQQWFTIFPYNPVARTAGVVIVTFVVLLASYYNIRHYFIAWPRNSDTVRVFNLKS
jgi:hypothetical protein